MSLRMKIEESYGHVNHNDVELEKIMRFFVKCHETEIKKLQYITKRKKSGVNSRGGGQ